MVGRFYYTIGVGLLVFGGSSARANLCQDFLESLVVRSGQKYVEQLPDSFAHTGETGSADKLYTFADSLEEDEVGLFVASALPNTLLLLANNHVFTLSFAIGPNWRRPDLPYIARISHYPQEKSQLVESLVQPDWDWGLIGFHPTLALRMTWQMLFRSKPKGYRLQVDRSEIEEWTEKFRSNKRLSIRPESFFRAKRIRQQVLVGGRDFSRGMIAVGSVVLASGFAAFLSHVLNSFHNSPGIGS